MARNELMQDRGATRPVALVVLAVVVAALVGVGCGEDSSAPGTTAVAETKPAADSKADAQSTAARDELQISTRGNPVLSVRDGRRVEIHAAPGGPVVRTVGDETEFGSPRIFSVARTQGDWAGVPNPFTGNGALGWIRLDPDVLRSGYTLDSVVVDLSDYRAEVLRDERVVRSFTVTIGAPGTETPTGRFAVTDTFRGDLNPAYGCCAVALTAEQPNLDSGWIGGSRIAIHGTTGPLGQALSHGCIRAADRDVSALVNKLPPGTPVTVRA